jgi:glycyl-tRNA synthetase beta chain
MEFRLNISINDLFNEALNSYECSSKTIRLDLIDFIFDKVKFILRKVSIRDDIIESVLSLDDSTNYTFPILYERTKHINDMKHNSDFKLCLVNFKRLNNIIKSSKFSEISDVKVDLHLFDSSEEEKIYNKHQNLKVNLNKYLKDLDYQKHLLKEIIDLHYVINSFFEKVIVNHEDKKIKNNRLMLLKEFTDSISKFSNFDLIQD